jgi:ABC-type molybdenum transport system ATPase subunit/photorepair protein PhrA
LVHINADSLELSADRGPVYGPLTFAVGEPLTVIRGDAGSGRTSLLLTLAGRMKADAGDLTVGEYTLPRDIRTIQKLTGISGFAGIDDLEQSVTVGAALRERKAWLAPWWARVRKLNDVDVAELCADVFGENPIPHANTVIWDLDDASAFLLRIALAMVADPEILFVDDIEQIRGRDSRSVIWARLAHLSEQTAVVVAASSLDIPLWGALDIDPDVVDMSGERVKETV